MTLFDTAYSRSFSQWQTFETASILVYFSISVSGTGWSESGIETIVINYVDGLRAGDDIVAADLTALLVADSTIDSVQTLQFSRLEFSFWAENPPETTLLKIFSVEQATATAASITTQGEVPIWFESFPFNSTIRDAVLTYGAGLSQGDDVDYSALDAAVDAAHGSDVLIAIGKGANWSDTNNVDIPIAANELAVFDASRMRTIPT